jgi:hypothetical protein
MPLAHWTFFETIDEDLHAYSRYLEFHERNFGAFSINLARLYLSICSEIDVLAKAICKRDIPASNPWDISDWRKLIIARYPLFPYFWVNVKQVCTIQPWEEWITTKDKNPFWWGDYNDVKHHRDEFFYKANLENVLCSAAGLLVMLTYWYGAQVQNRQLRPRFRTLELHPYLDMQIVTGTWRLENLDSRQLPKETLSAIRARERV